MYHELYGLKKEDAENVMKYIVEMYVSGKSIRETIYCYESDVKTKRFCSFICGVICGAETRLYEEVIFGVLDLIRMLGNKRLIYTLAMDICESVGCDIGAIIDVLEMFANNELDIVAIIDNEWSIWKHFMCGFFVGLFECYDENFNISVHGNNVKVKYSNVMERRMRDII